LQVYFSLSNNIQLGGLGTKNSFTKARMGLIIILAKQATDPLPELYLQKIGQCLYNNVLLSFAKGVHTAEYVLG
jgi:hypothetical protein